MPANRFHISPTTGKPERCKADKKTCPLGGEHFATAAEANKATEESARMEANNEFGAIMSTNVDVSENATSETGETKLYDAESTVLNGRSYDGELTERVARIESIVDMQDWQNALDNKGFIQSHSDELGATVYKYSQQTVYARDWNSATLAARGLIISDDGEVIGRGFDKFFNYSEPEAPEINPDKEILVMDKCDGSLGLCFEHNGEMCFATGGSFTSEQAAEAKKIWAEKYSDVKLPKGWTAAVEIIYPGNRIVVDYGDKRDLILLAGRSVDGDYCEPNVFAERIGWTGEVTENRRGTLREVLNDVQTSERSGVDKEGFVIRDMETGGMAKVKYPNYLSLHKVMSNCTPKTVWEQMANGTYKEFVLAVPDEFQDEIKKYHAQIEEQKAKILSEVDSIIATAPAGLTEKKDKAIWVQRNVPKHLQSYVMNKFAVGKPIDDLVLRRLKPEGGVGINN